MTREDIRKRNWQKARLAGFGMNDTVMTETEQDLFQELMRIKFIMLDAWDSNTEILIGHPLPPHKCHLCGKRSNQEYIYDDEYGIDSFNLCRKHYLEFTEEL